MITTGREFLEFLVKNPEGPRSNFGMIDRKLSREYPNFVNIRQASDNKFYYTLTGEGREFYKNVYAPVSFSEKILGVFFSKFLRIGR